MTDHLRRRLTRQSVSKMVETPENDCPIPATHDKYFEAGYFLVRALETYHEPFPFQFNLNAFIQASRNITFMLQAEPKKFDRFNEWYEEKREEMRANPLLKRFVEARNIVVKRSSLTTRSNAKSGLFRGRKLKLVLLHDIPPYLDTREILARAVELGIGFVDPAHSSIGEQVGVEREWIAKELGDTEVINLCQKVHNWMGDLLDEVHVRFGMGSERQALDLPIDDTRVMLETDVDPSLVEKWGW